MFYALLERFGAVGVRPRTKPTIANSEQSCHEKYNLGGLNSHARDSAKTQHSGDQGDDENCQSPTQDVDSSFESVSNGGNSVKKCKRA